MLRRFDEVDSAQEISSIFGDLGDFKSSTQGVSKLNDSFESTFMAPGGSEESLNSQNSFYEEFRQNKPKMMTLQLPRAMKNSVPLRQVSAPRPVSILQTTFLPDDEGNYNLPKKLTPTSVKRSSESSLLSVQESKVTKGTKGSKGSKTQKTDDLSELENQILKKDALIETLRMRVAKMVDELESTHRKVAFSRGGGEEIREIKLKCEAYEKKILGFERREKELEGILLSKEKEITCLNSQSLLSRTENDENKGKIFRLETEILAAKQKFSQLEGLNLSLQARVDSANKALELNTTKLIQAEKEVSSSITLKRTIDENNLTIYKLTKQLQDAQETSANGQKLLIDSQANYDSLSKSHHNLTSKLQSLEDQLSKIDQSIRSPLQERRDLFNLANTSEPPPKPLERQFTFNHLAENTRPVHKKSHSINACSKSILREIMEVLDLGNSYEIIPSIKKLTLTHPEKKLVKKLTGFVRDCVFRDTREVTPGQVWRLVKKVFEDYASIVKNLQLPDLASIRQCIGEGNWPEKISTLTHEHKILRDLLSKLRHKLKIPVSATVSEIELAISSIRIT